MFRNSGNRVGIKTLKIRVKTLKIFIVLTIIISFSLLNTSKINPTFAQYELKRPSSAENYFGKSFQLKINGTNINQNLVLAFFPALNYTFDQKTISKYLEKYENGTHLCTSLKINNAWKIPINDATYYYNASIRTFIPYYYLSKNATSLNSTNNIDPVDLEYPSTVMVDPYKLDDFYFKIIADTYLNLISKSFNAEKVLSIFGPDSYSPPEIQSGQYFNFPIMGPMEIEYYKNIREKQALMSNQFEEYGISDSDTTTSTSNSFAFHKISENSKYITENAYSYDDAVIRSIFKIELTQKTSNYDISIHTSVRLLMDYVYVMSFSVHNGVFFFDKTTNTTYEINSSWYFYRFLIEYVENDAYLLSHNNSDQFFDFVLLLGGIPMLIILNVVATHIRKPKI